MQRKRKRPRLAPGEMEILQMLWQEGPVTLSGAQRALKRPVGYTTIQTRLNRLAAKGVVARSTQRPALYRAMVAPEEVSLGHLESLLERVRQGSVVPMVAHLMKDRRLTQEEITELKKLVAQSERQLHRFETEGGKR